MPHVTLDPATIALAAAAAVAVVLLAAIVVLIVTETGAPGRACGVRRHRAGGGTWPTAPSGEWSDAELARLRGGPAPRWTPPQWWSSERTPPG